ncbi:MAG: glycosyltransferase, partial [Proteobacteria bacterium]
SLIPQLNAELVAWVKRHCTGTAVILINAEVELPDFWQQRLLAPFDHDSVAAVTALTCDNYLLSPLPADFEFKGTAQQLDAFVSVLAPAKTFLSTTFNPAILALADINQLMSLDLVHVTANLLVQAHSDGPLLTSVPNIGDQHPLPAHPMAAVQWLIEQQQSGRLCGIDYPLFNGKANLLHVVMDWGGGVRQWLQDFIATDVDHNHFVLVSQGEYYRQRYGEKFSLYYGDYDGLLLAQFELTPSIDTVVVSHQPYQAMLSKIITDYDIAGLMVSSLIGHAMDCLSTGLPTVRVLHDYFPHWPSLDARLDTDTIGHDLLAQILQNHDETPFADLDENQVSQWQRALNSKLSASQVQIVVPDQSVIDNIRKLPHSDCYQKAVVIPHGVSPLKAINYQAKKEPFTVLVLGRLIAGKGKHLLRQVMAQEGLADVQWLLLGCGDGGDDFKGYHRVNVIKNYQRTQLPELLTKHSPQLALIPAVVSETFSYVLSELQMMAIPVLATRVGALNNRIINRENGFLVKADGEEIIQRLLALKQQPELLNAVHKNLLSLSPKSLSQMVTDYQAIMVDISPVAKGENYQGLMQADIKAERLLQLNAQYLRLTELNQQLYTDLTEKVDWAKELDQQVAHLTHNLELARDESVNLKAQLNTVQNQLKLSQQAHEQAVLELSKKMDDLQEALNEVSQILNHKKIQIEQLNQQQQVLTQERNQARDLVEQMMRSRSWRLTRPLRGLARILRHLKNKISYRFRQLLGLPKRVNNSVKTRGVKATWQLAKQKLNRNKPQALDKAKNISVDYQPLQLNTSQQPVVSVIIPVYNHFQHSYHCLQSISEINDQTAFEVIVVDDCSTDETSNKMSLVSGIRYHRQAQNGGFIRSCNQGAKLARGDYLLFLNNDTEVKNQWLDALLDTFTQQQNVGLVGSQLRYPDGRLQEAGGIVFSDASGWNYGRLESPEQPEVAFVRAVSYCSGASIMVPTALFKELGCFDERYVPAYYEDTDLAFAVRAAGLRVLYQPRSQVIHFEGISSGTDLNSGIKKYQLINQQKFADKWQHALTHQPPPGAAIEQARFQESNKRILIVDACTPTPDQDSGSLRMLNIIQIMQALGFHVSFMPENMAHFGTYTEQLQQLGVECVYAPTYASPVDYLAKKGQYFSVVMLSRYYVAQPLLKCLKDYAANAQLWFDTVDLHYLREQRMAELAADKAALKTANQTKIKELAVARACDLTLVVSPYEQSVLAKEQPDLKVSVLSNIHEIFGCQKDYQQRRDIVFMGGYQHTPNVDGICWFVADIWPQIHAELPDVVLHIVGSKAPDKVAKLGQLPGIQFHG